MQILKRYSAYLLVSLIVLLYLALGILTKTDHSLHLTIAICVVVLFSSLISAPKQLIPLLILCVPLSVGVEMGSTGTVIGFPSEMLTILLLFILGFLWLLNGGLDTRILMHPLTVIILLDILWSLVCTVQSDMPFEAMKRTMLKSGFIAVYYFSITHWMRNAQNRFRFYLLYGIGMIIPVCVALYNHSEFNFVAEASFPVPKPFFSDHTIYGACLAFIIPFLIIYIRRSLKAERRNLFLLITLLVILLVGLFFSFSRASWISLIISGLFFGALKMKVKPRTMLGSLLIIGIVLYANFDSLYGSLKEQEIESQGDLVTHIGSVANLENNASNLERVNRWVSAYHMFLDKPVFGFGPGTYQFNYGPYQSSEFLTRISTHNGDLGNAHSEYFTALSETGIVGFIFLIALIGYSVYTGVKTYYENNSKNRHFVLVSLLGLITFFVHGAFNTFWDYEKMAMLVYGSLGILVLCHNENRELGTDS